MNLELIDPFGRQIPDRIDATLQLSPDLHFRNHDFTKKKPAPDDQDWKAAYHVSFNRRGTYLAVGYGSGTVAVFNLLSRSLSALYQADNPEISPTDFGEGVTSVTWSRRSRTLLSGAAGDKTVTLWDATHPFGPEEACKRLGDSHQQQAKDTDEADDEVDAPKTLSKDPKTTVFLPEHKIGRTKNTSFADANIRYATSSERRRLEKKVLTKGKVLAFPNLRPDLHHLPPPKLGKGQLKRHPCLSFDLDEPAVGSMQVNPRIRTGGLATLASGSLVLFFVHLSAFVTGDTYETPKAVVLPLWDDPSFLVTCACFDSHGDRVYAATRDGTLMGFDIGRFWTSVAVAASGCDCNVPIISPTFKVSLGSSAAWHVLASRNGKYVVVNSADGALRLFLVKDCWEGPKEASKPMHVFQDVVTKVKFACCDLSGDGEYIVGGANGDDNKYELYIWNTSTGALMDKLAGPSVQLYSVAWHPTRSFLAAATSDGLVDLWGPRINWTAFAPDFQALPTNVEYVEREDEFDVDDQGRYLMDIETKRLEEDNENVPVDVTTVEKVPVFASDSEGEEEVFNYEIKVVNLLSERGRKGKGTLPAED